MLLSSLIVDFGDRSAAIRTGQIELKWDYIDRVVAVIA